MIPTPPDPAPAPASFAAAVSKIAVGEICRSAGYRRAEPAALRALSDVAAHFIAALARSAASAAIARGRTDCNLFDLVGAVEDLAAVRGFAAASDPARPLLRSAAVRELAAFVAAVEEVPFPRPIRWQRRPRMSPVAAESFAQLGREPPFKHVPRWLPCFPAAWWEEREKVREEPAAVADEGRRVVVAERGERRRKAGDLVAVRERVRFKLGLGFGSSGGKRKRVVAADAAAMMMGRW